MRVCTVCCVLYSVYCMLWANVFVDLIYEGGEWGGIYSGERERD